MTHDAQRSRVASLFKVKRSSLWVWPLVAAVALGGVGFWVRERVEHAMQTTLAEHLQTILRTEVTALRLWFQEAAADATGVARDDLVCNLAWQLKEVADLTPTNRRSLMTAVPQALLRRHLDGTLSAQGYIGYLILSREGRVLGSDSDALIGKLWERGNSAPFQGAAQGRATVLAPYASSISLPDQSGRLRSGVPTMVALAPLCQSNGSVFAVVGLRVSPELSFSQMLSAGELGQTGHTFAFNKRGVLLSNSRFDPALKALGLLPKEHDAKSILNLDLRDPLVDLRRGKSSPRPRSQLPLTRMAESATGGGSGVDVSGYRDVRGVKVVGAWAWMPRYQMGIATEVDASEAYEPVWVLRHSFLLLFGLLSASALGLLLLLFLVERLKESVQSAETKLEQLGQYSLDRLIGRGGCGAVYQAHHRLLRRPVAVKLLDSLRVDGETLERFEREVQLTSNLTHPNTVSIYDYGRTPSGVFYYAMEYLEGISLEELVGRFGAQPPGRVIHILRQVCGSLAEAHGVGLAHRDIKPPNILLTCRGGVPDIVKVVDFGLVEPIQAGSQAHAPPRRRGGRHSPLSAARAHSATLRGGCAQRSLFARGGGLLSPHRSADLRRRDRGGDLLASGAYRPPHSLRSDGPCRAAGLGEDSHAMLGQRLRRPSAVGCRAGRGDGSMRSSRSVDREPGSVLVEGIPPDSARQRGEWSRSRFGRSSQGSGRLRSGFGLRGSFSPVTLKTPMETTKLPALGWLGRRLPAWRAPRHWRAFDPPALRLAESSSPLSRCKGPLPH